MADCGVGALVFGLGLGLRVVVVGLRVVVLFRGLRFDFLVVMTDFGVCLLGIFCLGVVELLFEIWVEGLLFFLGNLGFPVFELRLKPEAEAEAE